MNNITMEIMVLISCIIGVAVFMVARVKIKTNELLKAINTELTNIKSNTNVISKQIKDELDI